MGRRYTVMHADKTPKSWRGLGGLGYFDFVSEEYELAGLTGVVIGAAFEVANTLRSGFLEKVYERALMRELRLRGVRVSSQVALPVRYKGHSVGEYFVDLLVEDELLVELKCSERLAEEHSAQCLNYLRAAERGVCLSINFQNPRLEWRRVVLAADAR